MTDFHRRAMIACLLLLHAPALAADAGAPPDPPSGLVNPLAAWSLDRLSATRDRPLFAPTRRPSPPPPAPVARVIEAAPAAPPPRLTLLGIVTEADGARAMVRTEASDKVVRARLGDEIAGWKVTQIEPRRVILSLDERSVSFTLFAGVGAKATRAPSGPPDPQAQNVAEERIDRRSGR
ncbi:MAG TPA: hypothetical protein VIY51_10050 [Xanthobacteraceae bacterium]